MKKLVIMAGGFHPPHLGHMALYNAAKKQFPDADVYVAATNDTSKRPFPFEIKAKLAQLAGVDPGHFIQVKSPFRPDEITKAYNPDDTELIYVRSEKDIGESPKPGGVKKDGSPAYLQPFKNQAVQPMSKHAYIAYLPTVEFAGGITSATEIRNRWPDLSEQQKVQLVNTLYPKTKQNQRLAANVIKLLNLAIQGNNQGINEDGIGKTHISPSGVKTNMPPSDDDYEINYGKEGLVAKDRKARGVDVKTGSKKVTEGKMCPVCGCTPCNCTHIIKENIEDLDYVQDITAQFLRKVQPMRSRITDRKTIIGLLDRFFDKFAISEEYFDDVYHLAARRLESEQPVDEGEVVIHPRFKAQQQAQAQAEKNRNDLIKQGEIEDEKLKRIAAWWWNNDESPVIEKKLERMGWEIGQDEGYDEGGVFMVQIGDDRGDSFISWPAYELETLEETKKQSTQQKFEKHLKKHGYDVAEKSKYWDQKVKDIDAQIAAWDAEMQRRKRENLPESIKRAIMEGGHSLEDFDYMAEKK